MLVGSSAFDYANYTKTYENDPEMADAAAVAEADRQSGTAQVR